MNFKPTQRSAFGRHNTLTLAMTACFSLAIILAVGTASHTQAAKFHPLGISLGAQTVRNRVKVSEDGSVVVGSSNEARLIRWTEGTGPLLLGPAVGPFDAQMTSMSGDGSTVVATVRSSLGHLEAIMITFADDGSPRIKRLPVDNGIVSSEVRLISQDGSTLYGIVRTDNNEERRIRWTVAGVDEIHFDEIHFDVNAATSKDGDVLVGWDGLVVGTAARWTKKGDTESIESLPFLPTMPFIQARGVSSNGRWTVGHATDGSEAKNQRLAVRWDNLLAPEPLPPTDPSWGTVAYDVSADGSRIGGRIFTTSDGGIMAGLWTEESGKMESLQLLLTRDYGLSDALDGWQLTGVHDITDDGRYLVGAAIHTDTGRHDAFLVDMSPLSDLTKNGFVDFEDLTILLANWNKDVTAADGNLVEPLTTVVNFEDLTVLLADWTGPGAAGSPEGALGADAVPEPSTLLLSLVAALVGLPAVRRRRRVLD